MPFVKYCAACLVFLLCLAMGAEAESTGRFTGELAFAPRPDGRNMRLLKPFGYVDAQGQQWDVPAGAETDGASVPRAFWLTHPPFTGKYREAAVIHDYYCQQKSRGWKETHKTFYEAMRTSGVPEQTAKVMYGAVYQFGPRWGPGADQRYPGLKEFPTVTKQIRFVRELAAWIKRDNPSAEEIEQAVEAGRISKKTD